MSLALAVLLSVGAAGAVVGKLLRVPMWALIGSLVAVAAVHLTSGLAVQVHSGWTIAAQVLIGTVVGSRLRRGLLRDLRGIAVPGIVSALVIVAAGMGLGAMVTLDADIDPVTAYFGMAPGGVGEMIAATTGLGGEPTVVAVMHVIRIFAVLAVLAIVMSFVRGPDEGR